MFIERLQLMQAKQGDGLAELIAIREMKLT